MDLIVNNINIFACDDSLSRENIKNHQQQDSLTKKLIEQIENKDEKTMSEYFIDSYTNLLMIKIKSTNKVKTNKSLANKIVLPKSLIKKCLEIAHSSHFGTNKTYNFIKNKYYWKGMFQDTKNFCENCSKCLESKPKPKKTKFELIPKRDLTPGEKNSN